jgi:chitinase
MTFKTRKRLFVPTALLAVGILAGCGGGDGLGGVNNNPLPVTVVISPKPVTVARSATQQFTVVVNNSPSNAVIWNVLEGATGGTINQQGLYTAPANPGTFHVVATSQIFTTKFDTATVTVP